MFCQPVFQASSGLTNIPPRAALTWHTVHNTFLLIRGYHIFGVHQHMFEGAQWTKHHLDVQGCEDSSDSLRYSADVWQGYGCPRTLIITFHPPPRAWVLVHKTQGVSILLQCLYNLLFFIHTLYTRRRQCAGSSHQSSHHCHLVCHRVVRNEGKILIGVHRLPVHWCTDGAIILSAQLHV